MYALPALLTPLQHITFTTEKTSNCINEELKGTNKGPINLSFLFFFHAAPSINAPECSNNNFTVLIISLIFSFKVNKIVKYKLEVK